MKCLVLLLIVSCFIYEVKSDLTLTGPKCGARFCQMQEYCSNYDNQCHPCSQICNQSTHNYDPNICIKDCQDYLHDIRYMRKDEGPSGKEDLRGVVQKLQYMVTVTLTLTCFVLISLAFVIIFQIWKWKKSNNITFANICNKLRSKKSNDNKSAGNGVPAPGQVNAKPDLRLDMPSTATHSEHSPATCTTSISRRPAEDSALDYAYDNRAMSSSPSPNNTKPHESNF
ncbi:hypothetical protein RI129_004454 [Pyrocoelia pectoralis]|uniref:Protein grindelwald n=1 Tax=Pyrocoelia pectoralis TaxID=417401 RepID=A0AAN7VCW8_9COLE